MHKNRNNTLTCIVIYGIHRLPNTSNLTQRVLIATSNASLEGVTAKYNYEALDYFYKCIDYYSELIDINEGLRINNYAINRIKSLAVLDMSRGNLTTSLYKEVIDLVNELSRLVNITHSFSILRIVKY